MTASFAAFHRAGVVRDARLESWPTSLKGTRYTLGPVNKLLIVGVDTDKVRERMTPSPCKAAVVSCVHDHERWFKMLRPRSLTGTP